MLAEDHSYRRRGDMVDQADHSLSAAINDATTPAVNEMKFQQGLLASLGGVVCTKRKCSCGEWIGEKRLKALPTAVRCKDCEEALEKVRAQK